MAEFFATVDGFAAWLPRRRIISAKRAETRERRLKDLRIPGN
jgi:hypothetical protein